LVDASNIRFYLNEIYSDWIIWVSKCMV